MRTEEHQDRVRGVIFRNALVVVCALGLLVSCATPPAQIHHVEYDLRSGESDDQRLYRFVESAVNKPDAEDAAQVLGSLVEMWKERGLGDSHTVRSATAGLPDYRVSFAAASFGCYTPDYFDQLNSAANLEVNKINHYRKRGVGAPLVALRENTQRESIERYYPPEAITRPLTAVVRPGARNGDVRDVQIALLCPLANPELRIGGRNRTLAADYSAPWATFLSRTGKLSARSIIDTFTPTPKRDPQLYLMEPYDPDKEPLLMVHGLFSSPLAWAKLSNEMWADDTIRNRYQIWHYLYNTSAPPLYSGRILRTQLRQLRSELDPQGRDRAWKNLTIIAHSMGGIVTKSIVSRPKDAYWEAAFTVPHEELQLSAEDRVTLNKAFEWEPISNIRRIIFVAVPHRGSDFADNAIGRLGRVLTRTPNTFRKFYHRVLDTNPEAFTPDYEALGTGKMNAIGVLSPKHPTLKILSSLPFAYPIKIHSIIGDRGKSGTLEESSDGVVPYWSSHLDGVRSEKVIPSDHGAYDHPEGVAEITRILKLRD